MKNIEKRWGWVCTNDDDSYHAKSEKSFASKSEAYNDMRNAALEKMKWNTDYDEDLIGDNCDEIGYRVRFCPEMIEHESYSGTYTYKIIQIKPFPIKSDKLNNDISNIKMEMRDAIRVIVRLYGYGNGRLDGLEDFVEPWILRNSELSMLSVNAIGLDREDFPEGYIEYTAYHKALKEKVTYKTSLASLDSEETIYLLRSLENNMG